MSEAGTEIELEILRRAATLAISPLMLQHARVEVLQRYVDDFFRMHASWSVVGRRAEDVIRVPDTWWQHLKEWLYSLGGRNEWMVEKWPVRYRVYRAYEAFPAIRIPDPQLDGHFTEWMRE